MCTGGTCRSILNSHIELSSAETHARTIADLEESSDIFPKHLAEALQFRTLDKGLQI